ncbi:MAG TPA: hypothetical protein VGM37_03235 [Armatimonadota bacterium]|jgi:hypothetical protein
MPTPRKHENAAACQAAYRKRQLEARRIELQKKGLPALPVLPTIRGEARWKKMLAEAGALLSTVVEEREAYHGDRSEDWRESEKGETLQERTDAVSDILASLDDLAHSS